MALLSTANRRAYFRYLGLGEYCKANILKFQKMYFTRKQDLDGEYGPDTDNLLRHCYNVKKYTKDFKPEEFKCGCGRKYCTGYPTYMKPAELANLQRIRTKYGKPMQITSGMRCKGWNSRLRGASANSKHLTGQAADFYMASVTDTLANRKKAISYIKTLPNHNWTYGNGWCSKNYSIIAPNMGNALHTDSTNAPISTSKALAINETALRLAWAAGTSKSKYKYKGGAPTKEFKTAWNKYYPSRKNSAGCHQAVMLVLRMNGYGTMPMNWSEILKFMKKKFKQIKVNYTMDQLKAGDIRIHKNSSGGHHIWIIGETGGKKVRVEANQSSKYFHVTTATGGNTKKHKRDYLFRAK